MNGIFPFVAEHGTPVLFLATFAEQAGLPLPSAPWLLAAGALAAAGRLSPMLAITLATLGCVTADFFWFYLGRVRGHKMLDFLCRVSLAADTCPKRTEKLFLRHGMLGLVTAKFLPGLGAVMPPLAGVFGVGPRRFLFFDAVGSMIYGAFYVVLGYLFSTQVRQMLAWLNRLGIGALGLLLGLALGFVGFRLLRRRRTHSDSSDLADDDLHQASAGDSFSSGPARAVLEEEPASAAAAIVEPCMCAKL